MTCLLACIRVNIAISRRTIRPTRYTVLNASDGLQRRLLPSSLSDFGT